MPAPRKVDLLPAELRGWLDAELKTRGFADYQGLAEALNWRLEESGLELRVQKSALHAYGADFRDYAQGERAAQAEMRVFFEEASMRDEAVVTKALFQQLTTIQYRLQKAMAVEDALPDPKGMKDLSTALNNLIRSSSLRDALLAADRKAQAAKLDAAVVSGDIEAEAAAKARRIMGFAA